MILSTKVPTIPKRKIHPNTTQIFISAITNLSCEIKKTQEAINKAPVAKPWQSVTPDEVHEAFNFVELVKHLDFDRDREAWCEAFAAYIESKLKDKNQ